MPAPTAALLAVLLAAAGWGASGPASAGSPAGVVHPHLFNSDENVPPVDQPAGPVTTIFASSTQAGTDDAEDAVGNGDGPVEPDTFIFGDNGQTADNGNQILGDGGEEIDTIEWATASPVEILGYHLSLTQQDPFGRRGPSAPPCRARCSSSS